MHHHRVSARGRGDGDIGGDREGAGGIGSVRGECFAVWYLSTAQVYRRQHRARAKRADDVCGQRLSQGGAGPFDKLSTTRGGGREAGVVEGQGRRERGVRGNPRRNALYNRGALHHRPLPLRALAAIPLLQPNRHRHLHAGSSASTARVLPRRGGIALRVISVRHILGIRVRGDGIRRYTDRLSRKATVPAGAQRGRVSVRDSRAGGCVRAGAVCVARAEHGRSAERRQVEPVLQRGAYRIYGRADDVLWGEPCYGERAARAAVPGARDDRRAAGRWIGTRTVETSCVVSSGGKWSGGK